MIARFFIACALVALPCASAAAVPVVAAGTSTTIRHLSGATIIRASDSAATLVGVQITVATGLNRQTLAQNGLAALTAQTILRTPVTPVGGSAAPLEDAIATLGGSVKFSVGPSDVRFYVQALPSSSSDVLALFARALAAPDMSAATLDSARAALDTRITDAQALPLNVGIDMIDRADASTANTALPNLGTPTSLAQFVSADVRAFYEKYYRRGGVYVSAVGALNSLAPGTLATLALSLPSGSTSVVTVHTAKLDGTSRQLVTHRSIGAPWLIARYAAPPLGSADFGPMLVLTAFLQRTLADVAEVPGVISPTFASSAVGASYTYNRAPASLVLYVNGGVGNPNRAFTTALSVARVLASAKLNGSIEQFKAIALGAFATGTTMLQSRAFLATIFAQQAATPDYQARVTQAIAATTPVDLQRVARKYLTDPTIALVLPRQQN